MLHEKPKLQIISHFNPPEQFNRIHALPVAPKLRSLVQQDIIVSGFDIPQIIPFSGATQNQINTKMYIDDSAAPPPSFLSNFGDLATTAATFIDLDLLAGTSSPFLENDGDLSTTPGLFSEPFIFIIFQKKAVWLILLF